MLLTSFTAVSLWAAHDDTWKIWVPLALVIIGMRFYVEDQVKDQFP